MRLLPVGIALGSNLGNRSELLDQGIELLKTISRQRYLQESLRIKTEPMDCPPGSESFLNSVAEIQVHAEEMSPQRLLGLLQAFERHLGRTDARAVNAPRPLDLDILYFGPVQLNDPNLVIPHPRLTQRRFVLEPLAHLRPHLILPGQTQTVQELLAVLL